MKRQAKDGCNCLGCKLWLFNNDFLDLISTLTNFIQNEQVSAYNEGVDDMLENVRQWMRENNMKPLGENLPGLLNDIRSYVSSRALD